MVYIIVLDNVCEPFLLSFIFLFGGELPARSIFCVGVSPRSGPDTSPCLPLHVMAKQKVTTVIMLYNEKYLRND